MPAPSKFTHAVKTILSIVGVVSGAVLAIYAPAYVQPAAAVLSAVSGLFGLNETNAYQKSWAAYKSSA